MKRIVITLTAVLALAGCGPRYQAITFDLTSEPPIPVRVEFNEIEVPVGVAVAVHAKLESSTAIDFVEEDQLELVSKDRDIFDVEGVAGTHNFAFVGVAVGETCLSVLIEHSEEDCVPVRVTAPPS